jgi:uncharacterized protein (TIGR02391 family)
MARKFTPPPDPQPARLSIGEMQAALPKLRRRLAEVEAFDPTTPRSEFDAESAAIIDKVNETLVAVFGHMTLDYKRYHTQSLYAGPLIMGGVSRQEVIQGYQRGKELVISRLKTAIAILEEKLADAGAAGAPSMSRSLGGLDLHPIIERAAGELYRDGHYASAIENACKALNSLVQTKSGVFNLSEKALMLTVFNRNKPRLAFNNLEDETDRSEQEGMMHLYAGVFAAFRNPRAHKLIDDDAETAFGAISMISFLAKLLEKAKVQVAI